MNKIYARMLLLILFVFAISGAVIYFTVDINTITNITVFKPWSVALAIFFVGLGLVLDGTRLMHMVKISNEHITLKQAVQVVFGNYFLAMLGPGASAGAVAQLMFLRHAGVPSGKATIMVIVRTLVSILFLVCCMPFIFLHDDNILPGVSNLTLMVISVLAFVGIMFIVWAFKTDFLDYFAMKLEKKLPENKKSKFTAFYYDSKKAVKLLADAPLSMVRVFIESGLSLICIYMVVPMLMLGLGVEFDWVTVMGRMIFLNMLLYFSPTPGGSGIAEGGFVLLFSSMVPAGTVGILAVSWRLFAEYIPFLIGLYFTLTIFGREILQRQLDK